jgi:hypothetical protein
MRHSAQPVQHCRKFPPHQASSSMSCAPGCLQGGDWILQERIANSSFIASLLPDDAPLSTLRVITGSRQWLMQQGAGQQAAGQQAQQGDASSTAGVVEVMTVVFRAGETDITQGCPALHTWCSMHCSL